MSDGWPKPILSPVCSCTTTLAASRYIYTFIAIYASYYTYAYSRLSTTIVYILYTILVYTNKYMYMNICLLYAGVLYARQPGRRDRGLLRSAGAGHRYVCVYMSV